MFLLFCRCERPKEGKDGKDGCMYNRSKGTREEPSYRDAPHLNTLCPGNHNLYSLHNDAKVKTLLWIKEG